MSRSWFTVHIRGEREPSLLQAEAGPEAAKDHAYGGYLGQDRDADEVVVAVQPVRRDGSLVIVDGPVEKYRVRRTIVVDPVP